MVHKNNIAEALPITNYLFIIDIIEKRKEKDSKMMKTEILKERQVTI